jgi:malonyl-CoA/methylmalonyl-CoA synthetase
VDTEGGQVADGEQGELQVRGSNVFDGYWRAAEKTDESFTSDELGRRWFRTGDLACRDAENGYFTLLGRRTELIISGGYNIYPREVEEVLCAFPGIAEAAVVGVPSDEWGEIGVAYVVCRSSFARDDLLAFCRRHIAAFKVPKEIRLIEALPRNALGKVQKHRLPQ